MLNENSVIVLKNKKYTMEAFKEKFGFDDLKLTIAMAEEFVSQGKAIEYKSQTGEDTILEDVNKEFLFKQMVEQLDKEEDNYKKAIRNEKASDSDLLNIGLKFKTSIEAGKAEEWINSLNIEDTSITIQKGVITLKVSNITPEEYAKISRKYQMDKAIDNGVDMASKAINGTTDAINYTATQVIAPVAKIAGEAGLNVAKGITHTAIKTGAGLINSASKAVVDTKNALATDSEMLRAKRELNDAKNTITSFFKKKFSSASSTNGIERY